MAGIATDDDESAYFELEHLEFLKPFELTHSATPAELRKWARKFKAYFVCSKCYKQSLLVQNVLVLKFMDTELQSYMTTRAGDDVPIYGTAWDSYKQKYPEQGSNSIEKSYKKIPKFVKNCP